MFDLSEMFQEFRINRNSEETLDAKYASMSNKDHLKVLEEKIDSLHIMNLAALELLGELGISKTQVMKKIEEIDLRDGKLDGKVSQSSKCTDCGHKISKRRSNCFYCGASVNNIGF